MNGQETKKPFYKTFWFYVIVIPLFIYVIGKYTPENNKPSKNTSNKSTVDYEIVKTKFIGTLTNKRMSYKIIVDPSIKREQVKPLAGKIIKDITSKDKDIDEITLWFYSDMALVHQSYDIAMVDWGYPEDKGRIKIMLKENFEQIIKQRSKSETLYGLTEQIRRKFFKELVAAEDRASAEADRLIDPTKISNVKANNKKRGELEEKYKQEARQKYNITKEIEKKL
jgi:hypothetical protein